MYLNNNITNKFTNKENNMYYYNKSFSFLRQSLLWNPNISQH